MTNPTGFALLDRLLDAGLTTIDTAGEYSRWANGHQGGKSGGVIRATQLRPTQAETPW